MLFRSNNFKTLKEAKDWVYAVCFSPDGKTVVGGTWDGSILIWNVESGKLEATLSTRNPKTTAPVIGK